MCCVNIFNFVNSGREKFYFSVCLRTSDKHLKYSFSTFSVKNGLIFLVQSDVSITNLSKSLSSTLLLKSCSLIAGQPKICASTLHPGTLVVRNGTPCHIAS